MSQVPSMGLKTNLIPFLLNYQPESFLPARSGSNSLAIPRSKAFDEDNLFVVARLTHNAFLMLKATRNLGS